MASWKSRRKDWRKDGEQCHILQRYRKMKTEKGKGSLKSTDLGTYDRGQ